MKSARRTLIAFPAVIGTVICAVAFASGTAAATPASSGATPVGTWEGTVTTQGESHEATFEFEYNGVACISFGGPGEVSGHGAGTWSPTGTDAFEYHVLHDVVDPNGNLIGLVQVNQNGTQDDGTFTSSGTSIVFNPDGTESGTTPASVMATRKSTTNPSCQ